MFYSCVQMLFDVGQIVGSCGGGYLSSRLDRPITVVFLMLCGSVIPLYALDRPSNSLATTAVLLSLAGQVAS